MGRTTIEINTIQTNEAGEITGAIPMKIEISSEEISTDIVLEMTKIPGGAFSMGTHEDQLARVMKAYERYVPAPRVEVWARRQTPYHPVEVPSFHMSRYLVTQKQWAIVAGWKAVRIELNPSPSRFTGPDLPVERVSWEEGMEFCARLQQKTGKPYRLPSEPEWEYACRAGTDTEFFFGNIITPGLANYDGNYPYGLPERDLFRVTTIPVGSLNVVNAFGLHDVHGNLWEWCMDTWHPGYDGAPADGSAWLGGSEASYRVIRGGSWKVSGVECRSASRDRVSANRGNEYVGIRPVF